MKSLDDDLWHFALQVYAQPGVRECCLALQDDPGADVMVLLTALWVGVRRGRLAPTDLALLARTAEHWQQAVTAPLRQVRRWLKAHTPAALAGTTEPLREGVKDTERLAERYTAQLLAATLQHCTKLSDEAGIEAARHNAQQYLTRCLATNQQAVNASDLEAQLALLTAAADRVS